MDRFSGFWWSADSKSIAFTEVDERHIPPYIITHQVSDGPGWVKESVASLTLMMSSYQGKEDLSDTTQEEHR